MSTEAYNPVQIEAAIRKCSNDIGRGVAICAKAYGEFLDAEREYDLAFAQAYLAADGPAYTRKYTAVLATQAERERRDFADAAYRLTDKRAKALEAELGALQSVNKSVVSAYNVAGRAM